MKMGFTGTRKGMTNAQKLQVTEWLLGQAELHHGDCIGADEQAHRIAYRNLIITIHPPSDEKQRAFCTGADIVREPAPYLARNHSIVDETDILVAAPDSPEKLRSGTWATIRYARKMGKPLFIVMPDGKTV